MIGHATAEMTQLYSEVDEAERARAHAAAFRAALSGTTAPSTPEPVEDVMPTSAADAAAQDALGRIARHVHDAARAVLEELGIKPPSV